MKFYFYSFLKLCASHVEFDSRNEANNNSNPMRLNTGSKTMQNSFDQISNETGSYTTHRIVIR